ncbi:Uncharacterized protein LSUE1_G010040 [Lachnellula suecica]|uniref:DUF221-domain-containing protein n=1 Tax=Lachnellula suecica TaxID=602035 RepID=A0A8T9BUF5_9HELO|nr:Uncharacterized protein LSUE1_G010040 [Lachnellula suecica]
MSGIANLLNGTLTGSAGIALTKEGTTITTFVISLASGLVLFGVQFITFLIIRNYLWAKRIYQPRSFLVTVKQRIKPPPPNPLRWLYTLFTIKEDPEVLEKAGMDAYFFLRFLSMCFKIFLPMAVLIMPILIPLNVKGGKGTSTIDGVTYNTTGLDTLAWSNVSPTNTDRYWAHLILAVGVVAWVCYMFYRELTHYIVKRMEYISSPGHRLKASSTTVLIQDIPESLCNEEELERLYGDFPGGIRRIWINRDFTDLVNKDKLRKKYEDLLENTETDLLRKVAKRSRKMTPQQGEGSLEQDASVELPPDDGIARPETGPPTAEACRQDLEYDLETKAAWTKFLKPKDRKTMKIPKVKGSFAVKIPVLWRLLASTKIDVIYYCRRELARLNQEIEADARAADAYPRNYSAFVQFNHQKAAHMACQSVADVTASHMKRRIIEISPGDINWPSLNLKWQSRYLRLAGFLLLFAVLLLVFGLISFATGIISRVSTLSESTSWLTWIGSLPRWLLSFIQGTLPPVIQVIVLSGPLPILIRLLTNRTRGATTGQEGERSLQLWYFIFLFVELFLIPTISSGLTSVVADLIREPTSVPNILATNLPTAANYYFSFLIVQALSLSATSILQTIRLFKFYVIGHVNTPDAVFEKLSWTNMTRIGSNVPWYTTFAVIGLVYSVIAPLMLLFMLITFGLFWVVIKNNLLYCVRAGTVDGGGLFFPSAINQMFTGLYFMEFCLIGLFFLVRDTQDRVACSAQGIIMAVVLVLTILYQIWVMNHLAPLFKYAPLRLEFKGLLDDYDENRKSETESGEASSPPTSISNETALESSVLGDKETEPQRPTLPSQPQTSSRSTRLRARARSDAQSAQVILARLNQPLNEERLAVLEQKLSREAPHTGLIPRRKDIEAQMLDDPISKIIMQHNDELENLGPEERDMLISVAFMHPVLRETRPCVWIPGDGGGVGLGVGEVSDDEVRRMRELSGGELVVENRGAYFDRRLKVQVDRPPPDMSEFALIMAEL